MDANIQEKVKELLAAVRKATTGDVVKFSLSATAHGDEIHFEIQIGNEFKTDAFRAPETYKGPRDIQPPAPNSPIERLTILVAGSVNDFAAEQRFHKNPEIAYNFVHVTEPKQLAGLLATRHLKAIITPRADPEVRKELLRRGFSID